MHMRRLEEAVTNQQPRMSKVEEVMTTRATPAAADQKKTQDMMERMMRMLKEKRKKPHSDVELEDGPLMTNRPPAELPRWWAKTTQELVQATQDRLVSRQVESTRAEEATLRCS